MWIALCLCVLGIVSIVIGIISPLPFILCGSIGALCLLASLFLAMEGKGKK
ncbi:MAG: hypothetical protein IJR00_04670 [Lachnospiraceae bacterium]|nr:hypothetical protein [Lachnospiraceae bacterium]